MHLGFLHQMLHLGKGSPGCMHRVGRETIRESPEEGCEGGEGLEGKVCEELRSLGSLGPEQGN